MRWSCSFQTLIMMIVTGIDDSVTLCFLSFAAAVLIWIILFLRSSISTTEDMNRTRSQSNNNNCCPICLQSSSEDQLETNCGHVYCVACFMSYWRHEYNWTSTGPVRCPVCRQSVNLLLSCSSTEVSTQVSEYNNRFSGSLPSLMQQIRDLPTLIRHLSRDMSHNLVTVIRFRVLVSLFAAIAYVASPVDLVPEALFGLFGLLDDLLVLLLMALYVCLLYRSLFSSSHQ